MLSIAGVIKDLRGLGLSQTEIGRRTGIPQSRLSKWQAGAVPAAADDAVRLIRLHEALVGADAAAQGLEHGH